MNEVVDKHLGRLMKALALDRFYGVVESYRGVFDEGLDSIPEIRSLLLQLDLAKPRKQIVRTLTWLLALLHDIDEKESRGVADDLLNRAVCHPVWFETTLQFRSMAQSFTVDDFDEPSVGWRQSQFQRPKGQKCAGGCLFAKNMIGSVGRDPEHNRGTRPRPGIVALSSCQRRSSLLPEAISVSNHDRKWF